jgi:hypothetical protein
VSRRDAKAEARAINTVLWRDWDPIGCGVPEDEYESHVWPLYKLLMAGASRAAVADYLREVGDAQIGLAVGDDKLAKVVDKLLALKLADAGNR